MISIAIETSTPQASLCLAEDGVILSTAGWSTERNHDAHLFPALQQVMDILGNRKPDWVLVGSGPGSYGGVRVALAAAVGICTVTGARTVAICSWEALAHGEASIVSDARRGGWTLRRPDASISVISSDELRQLAADAHTLLYSTESAEKMQQVGVCVDKSGLIPTAEQLVRVWHSLNAEEREARASLPAEPIYVRPPHITEAKRKPWEIRP
ncbi:MAG: tRNA (adenosine(37)-N6)-threonylcarbamoyltransferase complex dimerization subunit type 1 TsaB [Akkermansia sp.]|nr:tRNA (adenosine(37)-N6)-threonylcarbamoyltransferase complex dimerization subunit type 1 TsaB [Akkermansia sp.]